MNPYGETTMSAFAKSLRALLLGTCILAGPAQAEELADAILAIQQEWARIHYQLPKERRDAAFTALETQADALAQRFPARAEPKVWQAIVLSTHAGVNGGLGALSKVRAARDQLQAAEKIDARALDGSVYTSLGSLYYQVPGWPLSFGDDKKAEALLQQALSINPDGIDPNYFYGDFLQRQGRTTEALVVLEKALQAPPRPGRSVADAGRRTEVQALIDKIKSKS
jgi:tetratricopeptide (TPR) repeat protein